MKQLLQMTLDEFVSWFRAERNSQDYDDKYEELNAFIRAIRYRKQRTGEYSLTDIINALSLGVDGEIWKGYFIEEIFTSGFSHGMDEAEKNGNIDLQPEVNLKDEVKNDIADKIIWLLRIEVLKLMKQKRLKETINRPMSRRK